MSVKLENDRIYGNTYEHRKTLAFHGCLYDKDNKNWFVPDTVDKQVIKNIVKAMKKNEKRLNLLWKQACYELGYKFVKKNTEGYEKVKAKYKKLLESSSSKMTDEDFLNLSESEDE